MVISAVPAEKKGEGRSRVDRESDNQQLMQLEEKDVVSSVATVLSDLCGPGEWMPMEKLHAELVEQFSNVCITAELEDILHRRTVLVPNPRGNHVKGFRFHPTDEELIEFLQIKTSDRDSLVQCSDEVPVISRWETRQLDILSPNQVDGLWNGISLPVAVAAAPMASAASMHCAATNVAADATAMSVLVDCSCFPDVEEEEAEVVATAMAARAEATAATDIAVWNYKTSKVVDPETGKVIGTKKTLVYYKNQCNDSKIKTCWVMHEYELRADPTCIDIDQKTCNLCKLKKKVDVSIDAGQLGQYNISLQRLMFQSLLRAMSEKVAINVISIVEKDDKSYSSILIDVDEIVTEERSNQHSVVVAVPGFGIPSGFEYLADDRNLFLLVFCSCRRTLISPVQETLHLKEMSKECNGHLMIITDDKSSSSILSNVYETVTVERSIPVAVKPASRTDSSACLLKMKPSAAHSLMRWNHLIQSRILEKDHVFCNDGHVETAEAQVGVSITYQQQERA
ncbi:hypothetical protein F3Y22_tig00110462pilonHSYRG00434 [Hibiscus syriacus]|uniref:NAC domain-containing protein n=1 Tax=Hibiscus syriacus TaxID=106335 RepID=A0A6A3AIP2_HIBSY|nr:hypothetical protein F3Y22_tig00110462pilonHSYRG00434 [Hibiscus syriacus]